MSWSHGTNSGYSTHGCRCEPCTVAHRVHVREWSRAKRRQELGIEAVRPALIDNAEAAEHLEWLASVGIGVRVISAQTGCSTRTLWRIRTRQVERSTPRTVAKILAIGALDGADGSRIDATATWSLIDELIAHGHTQASLANMLGLATPRLQFGRTSVTRESAERVKQLHHRLMFREIERRRLDAERQRDYRRRDVLGDVQRRQRQGVA